MHFLWHKPGTGTTPGFISLLVVALMGAIGVSVVVAVLVLGLNAARDSFALERAGQAKELAIACVENSLESIRASTAYLGTANLTLASGTCTATVTDLGGESRQIVSTGTVGTVVRRLTVVIAAINPNVLISSWQETP
jgi:hypothetical protein